MQRVVLRFIVIALVSGEFCIAFGAASAAEPKNEMVTLNAKPEPIAINPARTAVIVVDMENDFVAKGGMFDRAGADISGARELSKFLFIARLAPSSTRELGRTVLSPKPSRAIPRRSKARLRG